MHDITTDIWCIVVCVSDTTMNWTDRNAIWEWMDSLGPKERVLYGGTYGCVWWTWLNNLAAMWAVTITAITTCLWLVVLRSDATKHTVKMHSLVVLFMLLLCTLPSVLRRCWLGGRKGIRPVKNCGGVLAWLSVRAEVQICIWPSWCHCHSLSVAAVNPDWFYQYGSASGAGLPRCPGKKTIKQM